MDIEEVRKKIDEFMRWKAEEIKGLVEGLLPPENNDISYYTEEDAKIILNDMTPEDIMEVYAHLKTIVAVGESMVLDDWWHCPFCIVYNCENCPYGKVHNQCNHCKSDYHRARELLGVSAMTDAIGAERIRAKLKELFLPVKEPCSTMYVMPDKDAAIYTAKERIHPSLTGKEK